jgi:hypothetical protein
MIADSDREEENDLIYSCEETEEDRRKCRSEKMTLRKQLECVLGA